MTSSVETESLTQHKPESIFGSDEAHQQQSAVIEEQTLVSHRLDWLTGLKQVIQEWLAAFSLNMLEGYSLEIHYVSMLDVTTDALRAKSCKPMRYIGSHYRRGRYYASLGQTGDRRKSLESA
jgi:hypothetical protein